MLLGTPCGGVRRVLQGGDGALVDHWLAPVSDLYERQRARFEPIADEESRVNLLCELNVEAQVARVARTPMVRASWMAGRFLQVHGWIYGLKDGLIRDLGVTREGLAATDALPPRALVVDPTPVDDWSNHMRKSAIHLLRGACCNPAADVPCCERLPEAAE